MKLRTACSSLNHNLFLNNVVDSPNCSCHQGVPETNSHYLFYCHRFNDSRNRYIESIDIPMNLTVDRLLFGSSREATHRFRTSNNVKSNPEIKGRNSIFFRHDALQVSGHALFTSTPHVFLLNIFINKTERSIHFY